MFSNEKRADDLIKKSGLYLYLIMAIVKIKRDEMFFAT